MANNNSPFLIDLTKPSFFDKIILPMETLSFVNHTEIEIFAYNYMYIENLQNIPLSTLHSDYLPYNGSKINVQFLFIRVKTNSLHFNLIKLYSGSSWSIYLYIYLYLYIHLFLYVFIYLTIYVVTCAKKCSFT